MESKKSTLDALIDDHEIFHSDFQIGEFIINGDACGNVYGMYKQCLRELDKRKKALRDHYIQRRRNAIKHEEISAEIVAPMMERKKLLASLELDLKESELSMLDHQHTIKHTEREFQQFFTHASRLKEKLGKLTPERRAKLDREMWMHRCKYMIAMDRMAIGRLQEKTFRMMGAFLSEEKQSLVAFAQDMESIDRWWGNLPTLGEVIDTGNLLSVVPSKMIE